MNKLFRIACIAATALFLWLAEQLFFTPADFVAGLGLVPDLATDILARRTAMFLLGIAGLTVSVRTLPEPPSRRAIAASLCATFFGLASLSVREFLAGRLDPSILMAAAIEAIFGCLFAAVLVADLRTRHRMAKEP